MLLALAWGFGGEDDRGLPDFSGVSNDVRKGDGSDSSGESSCWSGVRPVDGGLGEYSSLCRHTQPWQGVV